MLERSEVRLTAMASVSYINSAGELRVDTQISAIQSSGQNQGRKSRLTTSREIWR